MVTVWTGKGHLTSASSILALGFVLYLIIYLASLNAGRPDFAGAINTTFQVLLDLATGIVAAVTSRKLSKSSSQRAQLCQISLAALLMACVNFTWGLTANLPILQTDSAWFLLSNRLPYLTVLSVWLLFWIDTLRFDAATDTSWHANRFLAAIGSAIVVGAVFLLYYFSAGPDPTRGRTVNSLFTVCYIALEFSGLLACVIAASRKRRFPFLVGLSYALLISSDLVFNTNELMDRPSSNDAAAEIIWSLSQVLLFLGIRPFAIAKPSANRSSFFRQFPAVLVVLPLLTVGSIAGIAVLPINPITRASLLLAAVLITAIVANFFIRSLFDAIEAASQDFLLSLRFDRSTSLLLTLTGVTELLTFISTRIVRPHHLPLGKNPLFDPSSAWQPVLSRQALICMPFREPWSDPVFDHLSSTLSQLGWKPVRADLSYTDPDALSEVWHLVCRSELIVVDITSTTPNVMYELGLCHAMAKATIVFRQATTKIPFNIATRRIHSYSVVNAAVIGIDLSVLKQAIYALQRPSP
jgi:hypothetical protein